MFKVFLSVCACVCVYVCVRAQTVNGSSVSTSLSKNSLQLTEEIVMVMRYAFILLCTFKVKSKCNNSHKFQFLCVLFTFSSFDIAV